MLQTCYRYHVPQPDAPLPISLAKIAVLGNFLNCLQLISQFHGAEDLHQKFFFGELVALCTNAGEVLLSHLVNLPSTKQWRQCW
jgi:hypothetical protein